MAAMIAKIVDWIVTRAVWVVIGFLLCIPILGSRVVTNSPPIAVVSSAGAVATHIASAAAGHNVPVEAPVTVHVSTAGVVTATAKTFGFCISPGFGIGHCGYPVGIVDVKLGYIGGWGAGAGLGIGRGVFPYWAVMYDPRRRGWSVYLGGGIIEKRAICGIRVRF